VQRTAKAAVLTKKTTIAVKAARKPAAKKTVAKAKPKATKVSAQSFAQATQVERQRQGAAEAGGVPESVANRAAASGCFYGFGEEFAISSATGIGIITKVGKWSLTAFKLSPVGFFVSCASGAAINLVTLSSPATGQGLQAANYGYDIYDVVQGIRGGAL